MPKRMEFQNVVVAVSYGSVAEEQNDGNSRHEKKEVWLTELPALYTPIMLLFPRRNKLF